MSLPFPLMNNTKSILSSPFGSKTCALTECNLTSDQNEYSVSLHIWDAAFFKSFTKLSVNKQESQSNTTLYQSKVCDTLSPFAIKKNTESKFDMYEEMTQLVWTCLIFLKASEKNNSKEILYKYEIWERERETTAFS